MNISTHALVNIIVSVPLKYIIGWDWPLVFIFIISGIIIDIDHLFFFAIKTEKFSIKEWIKMGKNMRSKMQPGFYVFHSPEFNVLLLILSFFNQIILTIFISNLIHIFLDAIEHYQYHNNFQWVKQWSIINSLVSKIK